MKHIFATYYVVFRLVHKKYSNNKITLVIWVLNKGHWGGLILYMTTQNRYDPRDIILYIDSFKFQIILYVYKVLKRKIWKSVRTTTPLPPPFTQRSWRLVSGRHDVSAPVKAAPEGRCVYDAKHNCYTYSLVHSVYTAAAAVPIIILYA